MLAEPCPVCGSEVRKDVEPIKDDVLYHYNCPRCGYFRVRDSNVGHLLGAQFTQEQQANASGWLRENPTSELTGDDVRFLMALATPTVGEKATKLLRYYAREHPIPGTGFKAGRTGPEAVARAWARNEDELWYLVSDYLVDGVHHLVEPHPRVVIGGTYDTRISPKGWTHLESLRQGNPASKDAFIAMWFDESMNPLRAAIAEAISSAGFNPVRIDARQHENDVNSEIIAAIRQSKFVVADFTGQRGGVYFEAGYAQGLGLKVIRTCRRSEKDGLHFDVEHYRFAFWEPDKLNELVKDLKARIIAAVGPGPRRSAP